MTLSRPHWLATVAVTAGLACGGGNGGTPPQPTLVIAKAAPSGDTQTDTVLATLTNPYRVLVTRDGAPAQGVTVTWSVPANQGSVSAASTMTGADGIASVERTLGPTAGQQTAQAATAGVTGSPVAFAATATAGNTAALAKGSGDGQVGLSGQALPADYLVFVRDAHGNGKVGVTVTWSVTSGGGSAAPPQSASGTGGDARTRHTLGSGLGDQSVSATAASLSATQVFTSTAVSAITTVADNVFTPVNTPISGGDVVGWRWIGAVAHNVTFEDPLGNSPTQTSGTFSKAFPSAGTFRYRCTIHSTDFDTGMVGRVEVQ